MPATDKIAAAVSAAQSAMRSTHVSSASLWDVCRGPLAANDLSLTQTIELCGDTVYVTTTLTHASGQKLEARAAVAPDKDGGRIGPMVETVAFHALLGLLALAAPNDDPAVATFIPS